MLVQHDLRGIIRHLIVICLLVFGLTSADLPGRDLAEDIDECALFDDEGCSDERVVALIRVGHDAPRDFYHRYLVPFYPKARALEPIFASLTFGAFIEALHDVTLMLTEEPLHYFLTDDEQGRSQAHVTHYWELILDQLSLINMMLKKCYVRSDGMLELDHAWGSFSPEGEALALGFLQKGQRTPFFDMLDHRTKPVVDQFYALAFDYVVKLFNEGILLGDLMCATRYAKEMDFLLKKLKGSIFEIEYKEAAATARELIGLLKQSVNNQMLDSTPIGIFDDAAM